MDFLSTLFKENPSSTLSNIVIIFFILILVSVSVAFYYDLKKNKLNEKKIFLTLRRMKPIRRGKKPNKIPEIIWE